LFAAGGEREDLFGGKDGGGNIADDISVVAAWLEEALGNAILSSEGAGADGVKVELNAAAVVDLAEPFLFGADDIEKGHADSAAAHADDGFDAVIGLPRFSGQRECFDGQFEVSELFRDDLQRQQVLFRVGLWCELYDGAGFVGERYGFERPALAVSKPLSVFKQDANCDRLPCCSRGFEPNSDWQRVALKHIAGDAGICECQIGGTGAGLSGAEADGINWPLTKSQPQGDLFGVGIELSWSSLAPVAEQHDCGNTAVPHFLGQTFEGFADGRKRAVGSGCEVFDDGCFFCKIAAADFELFRQLFQCRSGCLEETAKGFAARDPAGFVGRLHAATGVREQVDDGFGIVLAFEHQSGAE